MLFSVLLLTTCVITSECVIHMSYKPRSFLKNILPLLNSKQISWEDGHNLSKNMPPVLKTVDGPLRRDPEELLLNALPRHYQGRPRETFDARKHWPNCTTLTEIQDQGACSSCWAVAVVSAMTDRVCIQTKGEKNFIFSADDMLACCPKCSYGCNGGQQLSAWKYSSEHGVVSGGNYNSNLGCKPYKYKPCGPIFAKKKRYCNHFNTKPKCLRYCKNTYKKKYQEDLERFKDIVIMDKNNHTQQLLELFVNGPITAVMKVYEDFYDYKYGIYEHMNGDYVFRHTVKILGWGLENGIKYWLAANSWGNNWGDEGFFKILRGENHCGIEEEMVAGLYRTKIK